MPAKPIVLTRGAMSKILSTKVTKLKDGKKMLFGDDSEKLRCWQCKEELMIGQTVISKTFGKGYRIHYCMACATKLKII